jgi:uncharacterized membrane protein HdeD (DUF308 family)
MTNVQRQPSSLAALGLLPALADVWWLVLLRGIASIIFGVLAFVWPGLTVFWLVLLFAAYAIVDGVIALGAAFSGSGGMTPRWWLVIVGLLGIAAGIVTFMYPAMTAIILLYFIAGWMIASGVFTVVGAIALRKEIEGEWWLVLNGVLSVLIGLFMFFQPGAGALALIWLIGVYALVMGVTLVMLAFRLKRHKRA